MITIDGLTIEAAILCEDIREEVNRKHSLIGVFSGDILVGSFPATIRLAIYLAMRITEPRQREFTIRASFNDDPGLVMTTVIPAGQIGPSVAIVPPFFAAAETAGRFVVQIAEFENQWIELIGKSINAGMIPSVDVRIPAQD